MIPIQKELKKIDEGIISKLTSDYKGSNIEDFCEHITNELRIKYHFPIDRLKVYEKINRELDLINNQKFREAIQQIKRNLKQKSNATIYAKPEHASLDALYR